MPDEEQEGYTFIKLFSTIKAIIAHFRPFQEHHKVVIFRHKLAPLIFCFVSNTFERC